MVRRPTLGTGGNVLGREVIGSIPGDDVVHRGEVDHARSEEESAVVQKGRLRNEAAG